MGRQQKHRRGKPRVTTRPQPQEIEVTAASVRDAVGRALDQLGVSREEADVKVLQEPRPAFLGLIGGAEAVVRVSTQPTKADITRWLVEGVLEHFTTPVHVGTVTDDGRLIHVQLEAEDAGIVIGKHGQTLNALQYLVNVAAARFSKEHKKVILDVENYRARRQESLQGLAFRMASKAKRTGQKVEMEPMTAHERKIVHETLSADPQVATHSEGREPYRNVIITPVED